MAILGQFRGDLLSEWERVNPVIHDREFVLVKETVNGPWTAYKVGDGVNKFSDLPYGSNISVLQSLGDSETGVMSQKAVTDALNAIDNVDGALTDIALEEGEAQNAYPSSFNGDRDSGANIYTMDRLRNNFSYPILLTALRFKVGTSAIESNEMKIYICNGQEAKYQFSVNLEGTDEKDYPCSLYLLPGEFVGMSLQHYKFLTSTATIHIYNADTKRYTGDTVGALCFGYTYKPIRGVFQGTMDITRSDFQSSSFDLKSPFVDMSFVGTRSHGTNIYANITPVFECDVNSVTIMCRQIVNISVWKVSISEKKVIALIDTFAAVEGSNTFTLQNVHLKVGEFIGISVPSGSTLGCQDAGTPTKDLVRFSGIYYFDPATGNYFGVNTGGAVIQYSINVTAAQTINEQDQSYQTAYDYFKNRDNILKAASGFPTLQTRVDNIDGVKVIPCGTPFNEIENHYSGSDIYSPVTVAGSDSEVLKIRLKASVGVTASFYKVSVARTLTHIQDFTVTTLDETFTLSSPLVLQKGETIAVKVPQNTLYFNNQSGPGLQVFDPTTLQYLRTTAPRELLLEAFNEEGRIDRLEKDVDNQDQRISVLENIGNVFKPYLFDFDFTSPLSTEQENLLGGGHLRASHLKRALLPQ
nr:MAG TPA: hyaluronidase [Caudoviricetes sp.]